MNYTSMLQNLNDQVVTVDLEKEIYSKSTILKACYKFTDLFYIFINQNTKNKPLYTIYFQLKEKDSKIEDIVGQFNNELLDQELRTVILSETQKVRDAIVTRALLSGQPNDN